MSRLATTGFIAIVAVAGLIAYRVAEPAQLVSESDNRDLLAGIATDTSANLTAQVPTETPIPTARPTNTPKPPTATPDPTYVGQASPPSGYYVVPAWTETPPVAVTSELQIPPCITVTPTKFAAQGCNVP